MRTYICVKIFTKHFCRKYISRSFSFNDAFVVLKQIMKLDGSKIKKKS